MKHFSMVIRALFSTVIVIIVAAACAGTRVQDEPSGERVCLKAREIKSYTVLDERHVLVKARVNDYYLLTLDWSCDRLAFGDGVAIEGNVNQVCDDGFGSLVYRDSSTGVRRCTIRAIDPVKDADDARALVAERAKN